MVVEAKGAEPRVPRRESPHHERNSCCLITLFICHPLLAGLPRPFDRGEDEGEESIPVSITPFAFTPPP